MARILRGPGRHVLPAEVAGARQEAEATRRAARREADALLAAARTEAEALREAARREGREAGHAEVAALLLDAQALHEGAVAAAEAEVRRLAVAIGGQLLGEALRLAPERVAALVAAVLQPARRARELVVRLPPGLTDALGARPGVRVVEDATLRTGDVVIETELGRLDGRLAVRLEALVRALG